MYWLERNGLMINLTRVNEIRKERYNGRHVIAFYFSVDDSEPFFFDTEEERDEYLSNLIARMINADNNLGDSHRDYK